MKERKFATGPSGGLQQEHLDVRRKRLLFRCWHRGTKEGDLILGSFAETCLTQFDSAQLNRFEGLLNCSDTDLFGWIIGGRAPPREYDHDMMRRLRAFWVQRHRQLQHNDQPRT